MATSHADAGPHLLASPHHMPAPGPLLPLYDDALDPRTADGDIPPPPGSPGAPDGHGKGSQSSILQTFQGLSDMEQAAFVSSMNQQIVVSGGVPVDPQDRAAIEAAVLSASHGAHGHHYIPPPADLAPPGAPGHKQGHADNHLAEPDFNNPYEGACLRLRQPGPPADP